MLDSSWNKEGDASYPFAQSYNYVSGYNGDVTTDDNIKMYAVYQGLYPDDEGTQTVGKLAQNGNVRFGSKPNLIGLYDMSGNTSDFTEDTGRKIWSSSNFSRYILGGNFKNSKDSALTISGSYGVGYGFNNKSIGNFKTKRTISLRLVRSLID